VLKVLGLYPISQRRACVLIGVDPKTVRRERPPDHGAIRTAMREVAGQRRVASLWLSPDRHHAGTPGRSKNHKKLYRLYREERLSVRRGRGRKRARGSRTPMPVPLVPGACWSMDFVSDTFGASRKFRILARHGEILKIQTAHFSVGCRAAQMPIFCHFLPRDFFRLPRRRKKRPLKKRSFRHLLLGAESARSFMQISRGNRRQRH